MSRFSRAHALLLAITVLASIIPCQAASPGTSAAAYVLLDADSGRILCAKHETDELPIASTTKIMTALTALELGQLSAKTRVKREHLVEGSSMYLAEGEELTLEALLYGLLLSSGNDAAACIADACGGAERFVARMNEKAAELGMTHTSFKNPSGLDAASHYSCALDMARLMAAAMENPTFVRIASTQSATVGARSMTNHNKLLGSLDGCIAGKTGYTGFAGRTLVTCCERGGLRLIAVTLNDSTDWDDHAELYEYGFSTYRRTAAVRRGELCGTVRVEGGSLASVPVAAEKSVFYPLAEGEAITTEAKLPDAVPAPVYEGQEIGTLLVTLAGQEVARIPLVCAQSIPKAGVPQKAGLWERLARWLTGGE